MDETGDLLLARSYLCSVITIRWSATTLKDRRKLLTVPHHLRHHRAHPGHRQAGSYDRLHRRR